MQWFADLRIAYKIAIVPLALGLLLVALGVVSTVSLRSIASRVEVVTQDLGPSMDQLTKVTDAMARLQLSVRQFARNGDSAAEQQFAALDQRMSAALDQADARAVIAAIFHPPQPIDQPISDLLFANDSDNSAHCCCLILLMLFRTLSHEIVGISFPIASEVNFVQ